MQKRLCKVLSVKSALRKGVCISKSSSCAKRSMCGRVCAKASVYESFCVETLSCSKVSVSKMFVYKNLFFFRHMIHIFFVHTSKKSNWSLTLSVDPPSIYYFFKFMLKKRIYNLAYSKNICQIFFFHNF